MLSNTRKQPDNRKVGLKSERDNLGSSSTCHGAGEVQPVSPRKELSEELARVRRKLAYIRNGGFAALEAYSSQGNDEVISPKLNIPYDSNGGQQIDDSISDIMTENSECSDEPTELPALESMTKISTAMAKQILEVEGLDLDDMDMYMLSVQGMGSDVVTRSGSGSISIVSKSSTGTSSTALSSVSTTSTRSRRPGAAHGRRWRAEIAAIKTNQTVSGWAETMHAASRNYNKPDASSWHPKRGWLYRPMEEQFESNSFRLSTEELSEGIWEECSPFES